MRRFAASSPAHRASFTASLYDLTRTSRPPRSEKFVRLAFLWSSGDCAARESNHLRRGGMANHLYYGDNLVVLRESIKDESVDLVYLDPPFNSNAEGLTK